MEEKVLEILKQVLGLAQADAALSRENCPQWDSMGQLNLVVALELAFGVTFEPEEMAGMQTVPDIVHLLEQKLK